MVTPPVIPTQMVLTTPDEGRRNVTARYKASVSGSTQWALLVDLSDTVHWPHENTARLDASFISWQVDRASNAVGSCEMGVITRIDGTNGDLAVISSISFLNTADTHLIFASNFAPSQLRCGVSGGSPLSFVTNDVLLNQTGLQDDTALNTPIPGLTAIPAVGDIAIRFNYVSGGDYAAIARLIYHSEPSLLSG